MNTLCDCGEVATTGGCSPECADCYLHQAVVTSRSHGRAQLWEPCDRCGQEPCYVTGNGNLCATCDHPVLNVRLENSHE